MEYRVILLILSLTLAGCSMEIRGGSRELDIPEADSVCHTCVEFRELLDFCPLLIQFRRSFGKLFEFNFHLFGILIELLESAPENLPRHFVHLLGLSQCNVRVVFRTGMRRRLSFEPVFGSVRQRISRFWFSSPRESLSLPLGGRLVTGDLGVFKHDLLLQHLDRRVLCHLLLHHQIDDSRIFLLRANQMVVQERLGKLLFQFSGLPLVQLHFRQEHVLLDRRFICLTRPKLLGEFFVFRVEIREPALELPGGSSKSVFWRIIFRLSFSTPSAM